MLKKITLIFFYIIFVNIIINSNELKFFKELSEKKIATFNDGITLLRLLFNEKDFEATYIENIIWSIEKKLFRVTLPITNDKFNPILTRGIFAYWICKIYNNPKGIVDNKMITQFGAYKTLIRLDLLNEGKGIFDSISGKELIDTFAYIDYYVRANKIETNPEILKKITDEYDTLPEWRQRLYREIEEQRKAEKEALLKKKVEKKEKIKNLKKIKKEEEKDKEVIIKE